MFHHERDGCLIALQPELPQAMQGGTGTDARLFVP